MIDYKVEFIISDNSSGTIFRDVFDLEMDLEFSEEEAAEIIEKLEKFGTDPRLDDKYNDWKENTISGGYALILGE